MKKAGPSHGMRHEPLFGRGIRFGRGRTLQNLLQRIEEESLPLEVKALVVHRPCNAELIAASHDLPVHHIDAEDRGSCHHLLQELAPDLVVLAGWIRPFPTPAQFPPSTSTPHCFPSTAGTACMGDECTKRSLPPVNRSAAAPSIW